ncbi:L-aspartate oxidase [Rhizobium oryzicola]|uniref:L-aspartate oxidase n=1 Tax=Rhizobium oryzicola TaxID=1232668 RepID=A0ABT8SXM5_9HYPH|nr:L-aspartate oxidase [Rhizobium oryzicola]MDO1583111.1 L-aspartate oxidase [Rhizobium oryzicola]
MTPTCYDLTGRVIVVGSGIAGLVTALSLAPQPVILITRAALGAETSSGWAQGGIAASMGAEDSPALHLSDTLAAGDGLCEEEIAATILGEARGAIAALEAFGVVFNRHPDGQFKLGLEAAHTRRRILHVAGDGAGAAIMQALIQRVRQTPSIEVLEGLEVRRLLVADNRIGGLMAESRYRRITLYTNRVVLATGGLGGLYETTTNPSGNYGQGVMLAARAGAVLSDMEFVQFHPTALDSPQRPLNLISEALRGEGAIVVNEKGERFLGALPGAELGPRDMVARAIGAEISRGGRVFLDAREAIGARFRQDFPLIATLCGQAGIDPAHDLIPVRPAVHYHMGGVATDLRARSSVDGLWIVGEAACTGLHGANRLASNSLLEATVMALRAAEDVSSAETRSVTVPSAPSYPPATDLSIVREIATRDLSIVRVGAGLTRAVTQLLPHIEDDSPSSDAAIVAISIAVFAWLRQESRGAHARSDFPELSMVALRRHMNLREILDTASIIAERSPGHTIQRKDSLT